jgi:hypothetical protein
MFISENTLLTGAEMSGKQKTTQKRLGMDMKCSGL